MFQPPRLTNAGKALYIQTLAGEGITFTKIKLGKGVIRDPIATMTDLVDTVLSIDVSVSSGSEKTFVDVSGSFSNASLGDGFYWREIGVFVANPESPEDRDQDILYCYQNAYDTADFIPAASVETVEKHITVPILVADAENVSCLIDQSLIYATKKDVEAFQAFLLNKIQQLDKVWVAKKTLKIPTDGWSADPDTGLEYVDIPIPDVSETMTPLLSLSPASADIARCCGMGTTARTMPGALRLYAQQAPKSDINADLTLLCAFLTEGGTGGNPYVLPVATSTRLGGVKIGENVNVENDGTISVDSGTLLNDAVASDGDVKEMLDGVFDAGE